MLSKFFSLFHQTREDDLNCDNHELINPELGKKCIKLMLNAFKGSFMKYRLLLTQQRVEQKEKELFSQVLNDDDDEPLDDEDQKQKEVARQKQIDAELSMARDAYYAYSMMLRYFAKEVLEVIDISMLKDIINDFDLVIDGGMEHEFALRLTRTSLSCAIDTVFRLNKYNKQIFDCQYLEKLSAILDVMMKRLQFLILCKENDVNMDKYNMDNDAEGDKPKEDQFMMLYQPILESIPIISNSINDDLVNDSEKKLTKLLHQIIDVAVIYDNYLNIADFSNETKDELIERESNLQDMICCTLSVIWDIMAKYGDGIRQYILSNDKMLSLIENKWSNDDNLVLSNQAANTLRVLRNEKAFKSINSLNENKNNDDNDDNKTEQIVCPCGDILQLKAAKDCYPPSAYHYLYCDYCREKIDWGLDPNRMVYHCDKNDKHKHGFDLCVTCAKRKFLLELADKST